MQFYALFLRRKMKDISQTINYKGKEYKLVFNLNVMEEIQEEYGSVQAWADLTDAQEEPNAKAVKFGFAAMLNEGIDIANDENGTDEPMLSLKQVGRIITEIGLQESAQKINDVVIESTDTGKN